MKAALIVNPASAGGATGRRWSELRAVIRGAGLEFQEFATERSGDGTRLTAQAVAAGFDRIIAVGGDGTFSEVANGVLPEGRAPDREVRVGLIPQGTGGDFVRTVGIPREPAAAARLAASDVVRRIDVGLVRFVGRDFAPACRIFVNIADLGIGGEVVERVERIKGLGGRTAFQLASLATLVRYRNRRVRVEADGEMLEVTAQQVVVANCRYFGGGMKVAPAADPGDGQLDLVVFGDFGRLESIRKMGSIYRGDHLRDPLVAHRRVRRVEVSSDHRLLLDVDGEQPGMAPASFEVLPSALALIAPPG